mgnify:CR=1 FL=1
MITLYATCIIEQLLPDVGESVFYLLEKTGEAIYYPEDITCCGLPHFNNGYQEDAVEVLKKQIDSLQGEGPIVVPSGSCCWMLKNVLPTLFTDQPHTYKKATNISERVIELTQFLHKTGLLQNKSLLPGKTTYHDSCHLLRGLGESESPRKCLGNACELVVELEDSDRCCGFGGSFCMKFPEISSEMLDQKIEKIKTTEADWIVAADAGCILQIASGLEKSNCNSKILHIAQALAGPGKPGWPKEEKS